MDDFSELFQGGSIDYATFSQRAQDKKLNIVDLSGGKYVSKEKSDREYATLKGEFDRYKTDNDISKFADYDTIKKECEDLKKEKVEADYKSKVMNAGVSETFEKFVVSEVKALVTDKKNFETALKEFVEKNPQYLGEGTFRRGRSSATLTGNGSQNMDEKSLANKKINDYIRGI